MYRVMQRKEREEGSLLSLFVPLLVGFTDVHSAPLPMAANPSNLVDSARTAHVEFLDLRSSAVISAYAALFGP